MVEIGNGYIISSKKVDVPIERLVIREESVRNESLIFMGKIERIYYGNTPSYLELSPIEGLYISHISTYLVYIPLTETEV